MKPHYHVPIQIGYYNGKPITHTYAGYGKGIIVDTYFQYVDKYQENRLRVKIKFQGHTDKNIPVFDLLNCLEKGLLIFPEFDNEPDIMDKLEGLAQQEYERIYKARPQKVSDSNTISDDETIVVPEKQEIQFVPSEPSRLNQISIQNEPSDIRVNFDKNIKLKYNQGSYDSIIGDLIYYDKGYTQTNAEYLISDRFSDSVYSCNLSHINELISILERNGFEYFHHHTDISNFLKIMQSGKLYSRSKAKDFKNGAELSVISHTPHFVQDSVRFYFKEKTPTFFNNEGVFAITPGEGSGNVPIPVALLFDKGLLYTKGIAITDGNAGKLKTNITLSYRSALKYDWPAIFFRGPYEQDDGEITRKRNAEFLYPNEIDITKATSIVFRAEADKKHAETLLGKDPRFIVNENMFSTEASTRKRNFLEDYRISIENQRILIDLFFKRSPWGYTHIVTAFFRDGEIRNYNLDSSFFCPGNSIKTAIKHDKPIKQLEYSLNGNISAVWRP